MEQEKLNNILINDKLEDYDKTINHNITEKDIIDFNNLYLEFLILENEYKKTIYNRKETAKKLTKILSLLNQMNDLITRDITRKRAYYDLAMRDLKDVNINEHYKVLEVLKQLASNESVQYEIKTIEYPAFDSTERHGYRVTEKYEGEITILASKNALSKIDDSKKLPYFNQKMLLDIYNQGFSMVLVGNDEYMTEYLNIENMHKLGNFHPIVFYLQNDELNDATSLLMEFIKDNGADFSQIETNDIVNAIKSKYKKRNLINTKNI